MRVIIAEDEFLERKAMRKLLEEEFSDIEIVAEAINGRQAIELAEEGQPELMLMDIKMPGISGLQAMEEIYQHHPAIRFIMVTAFDTFEYAKQAMKYGVKDYILKPGSKEETIKAIIRVRNELAEDKRTLENRQALFLTKLMQGEEANMLKNSLFPNMRSGFFFALNVEAPLPEEYLQYEQIGFYPSEQKLTKAMVLTRMRQLQLTLGTEAYIGVGYPYEKTENFTHSYLQAKQALRDLIENGKRRYGFLIEKETTVTWEPLFTAIQEGDEKTVWLQFESLYTHLDMEAYFKIKQIVEAKGCHFPLPPYEQLKNEETWREFLQGVMEGIRAFYHSQNKIARAKQYMETHYKENVSLEDLSLHTELSSNYLSNLFHEETGMTIIDYLTEIRLRKAKELLQQNHATLKEISMEIGYRDPNYFSRVFKKNVGQSPKQYQSLILKK